MRKLLNTLYVIDENAYLSLDGENVVLLSDGKEKVRLPFTNLESIVCFGYRGCSPALMGKCAESQVNLCFVSPTGRMLARVTGEIKGNVFLRLQQFKTFNDEEIKLNLIKELVAAKLKNVNYLLSRSMRDNKELDENGEISACRDALTCNISVIKQMDDIDAIRGIEGNSAKMYFNIFDTLFLKQKDDFRMFYRTKRPPLDRVNAMLSFLYTVCTNDIAAALECVGLDPYIGFYHTLRPGRASLACDLTEEFRSSVERVVITLINLRIVNADDFEEEVCGAVLLSKDGRKKVITAWQNKKREVILHPIIKEKVQFGLFPYIQANLLAKFIRGEIAKYPNLVL